MAFVIQNESRTIVGNGGLGMGYAGIKYSLAVEIDTFQNDFDPNDHHIAVLSKGTAANNADHSPSVGALLGERTTTAPFQNGAEHTMRISYSATTLQLSVTLDSEPALVITGLNIAQLLGLSDGKAWVGFTGATGANVEDHELLSWNMFVEAVQPDTVGVYRPSNSYFYLRNSNSAGASHYAIFTQYAVPADIPLVGDWNGDGIDTPGLYRPSQGRFILTNKLNANGSLVTGDIAHDVYFGNVGDQPLVGDWNGDGIDTIGVFRPSTTVWYFSNSNSSPSAAYSKVFGAEDDIPVIGDWNGDNNDTIGVFREGSWFLSNGFLGGGGSLSADISFAYGASGDVPITGDWRGYRYTAIGVKRNDQYMLRNSLTTGFPDNTFIYGNSSDKPVFGRWGCLSGVTGGLSFEGSMAACMLASTATPTLRPTSTPIPSIDQTRTATYAATYTQGGCVVQVQTGVTKSLMDNNLASVLTTIPQGAVLVATKGRGRLQQQPDGYRYVYVSYGTQSGWIYSGSGLGMYPPAVGTNCDTLPLERLDYQAPTVSSPADTPLYYDYNQPINCTMPILPPAQAQCVYNSFQSLFIQTYHQPPTMKELLKLTIQAEWWSYRQVISPHTGRLLQDPASEGLSRAYFSFPSCSKGVCEAPPPQLFNFLSGYQPWLLGVAGVTPGQVATNLMNHYVNAVNAGADLDSAVELIFNPSPNDPTGSNTATNWATQAQPNQPFQWFTCFALGPNPRPIGTSSNQLYDRFTLPNNGGYFEIYTYDQVQVPDRCGN